MQLFRWGVLFLARITGGRRHEIGVRKRFVGSGLKISGVDTKSSWWTKNFGSGLNKSGVDTKTGATRNYLACVRHSSGVEFMSSMRRRRVGIVKRKSGCGQTRQGVDQARWGVEDRVGRWT